MWETPVSPCGQFPCGPRMVGSPRKEGAAPGLTGKEMIVAWIHVTWQGHLPAQHSGTQGLCHPHWAQMWLEGVGLEPDTGCLKPAPQSLSFSFSLSC